MASVFTYDPDPPKISSPWSGTPVPTPLLQAVGEHTDQHLLGGLTAPAPSLLPDTNIVKLEAEPQDGPTEYKLHLLLRPRRSFSSISTGSYVSGSHQAKSSSKVSPSKFLAASKIAHRGSPSTPPFQARQKRLEHLTTQLLWRLQQSSPYHSSSTTKLVPPALPETGPVLGPPASTGKLLPGLEESRGALYEIGVSDDGVFVGLTRDEMDESLINLTAMAASLGCKVEVLRTVIVGDCQWMETTAAKGVEGLPHETVRNEKLWVVEALVLPDTSSYSSKDAPVSPLETHKRCPEPIKSRDRILQAQDSHTEQIRISLTGGTTSGKSSLVGTLSTSALDSGRGKTRLNLLKHRHEIESGVTSSVAPELIGYCSNVHNETGGLPTTVVNYGLGNVSSWNDIHDAAEGERLVFLVDSAGHPRYRRTTVRGLVSWAPHWALCCIAADEDVADANSALGVIGDDSGGSVSYDASDVSRAHLELCLKLGLRLVIVITKLDVATNLSLRKTLSKTLSVLKAYQRDPIVLKPDSTPRSSEELQQIPSKDEDEVRSLLANNVVSPVPIVFTSAVKGSGIPKLHALLRHLPLPTLSDESGGPPTTSKPLSSVFYVDEIFSKTEAIESMSATEEAAFKTIFVLSGHLSRNELSIGDILVIGPFSPDSEAMRPVEMSRARSYPARLSSSPTSKLSLSNPRPQSHLSMNSNGDVEQVSGGASVNTPGPLLAKEWFSVRVTSIRNLRLPLLKLLPGQVGTVGVEFVDHGYHPLVAFKLRKGMVLIHDEAAKASVGFKAIFPATDYHVMEPGAVYNVYIVTIRASAKILSVGASDSSLPNDASTPSFTSPKDVEEDEDLFMFDWDARSPPDGSLLSPTDKREGVKSQPHPPQSIEVVFHFIGSKEWLEQGHQVLVMPKTSGLESCVGKIRELV